MATSNFSSVKNASSIFAVLMNREENYSECGCGKFYEYEDQYTEEAICEECGETVGFDTDYRTAENFEYDDLLYDLKEQFKNLTKEVKGFYNEKGRLGIIEVDKVYLDCEIIIRFTPTLESGYYEGAQLDFELELENWYTTYDLDCLDEFLEDTFSETHSDLNRGLATIHTNNARKWIESTVNDVSERINKVFESVADNKLKRVGGFSDGTSVYEEVK